MQWLFNIIAVACIAVLLMLLLIQAYKNRRITNEFKKALKEVVDGNLTYKFHGSGEVPANFSQLSKLLLGWVRKILTSSIMMVEQVNEISNSCVDSQKTAKDITLKMDEFEEKAYTALDKLNILSGLSEEMHASEQELAALSTTTVHGIKMAEENIINGRTNVDEAVGILEQMSLSMSRLVEELTSLTAFTDKVQEMTYLINNLASNINLLALNASIEAARAGESGKGFAVVAKEIGHLASESAQYSKNIREQMTDIKKRMDDTLKTIDNLAAMGTESKKSADSIKTYFDSINGLINNTIGFVTEFSRKISLQAESTQQVVNINQDISLFFSQFIGVVDKVTQEVKQQNDLELNNIKSCNNMNSVIANLITFTQSFENIISERLVDHCSKVAELIAKGGFTNDMLIEYAVKSGVSEFYITDEDGVTVLTNNLAGMGFRFPEDENSQAFVFRKILRDRSAIVSQNFKKRDIDGKYYKFVAISRKDKTGIVQAGLDAEDITNL